MRKIEQDMIAAVSGNFDWDKDNTRVFAEDKITMFVGSVQLHNNEIVKFETDPLTGEYSIMFNFCGYQTNTTKSRINAILSYFGFGRVFQKNHNLYYENSAGKDLQISNKEWIAAN